MTCGESNTPAATPDQGPPFDSGAAADSSLNTDSGPGMGDGGTFHGVTLGRLANNLCLSFALPTTAMGDMADCRIVLEGEASNCASPGLRPANVSDLTAIDAYRRAHGQMSFPGGTCELAQLPAGANCTDKQAVGWCYLQSSCLVDGGMACARDICTSAGLVGEKLSYVVVWLVCS
jgi:hypothetical protein